MIKLVNNILEADFITHAGNFHADDVFSTVFLEKLYDDIKLIRLNEYKSDKTKFAYDIGDGEFDHHSSQVKIRKNKIHYSSFGLLWHKLGMKYLKKINIENKQEVFEIFDDLFVIQIDAFDNGDYNLDSPFNIYTVSKLIELFRPLKNEDENTCFLLSVKVASLIFDQVLKDAIKKAESVKKIKASKSKIKDKILILDEFIPYEYALFKCNLDVDFVIYPSNRGGYVAHTVPISYESFTPKIPFKKEWAGLRDEKLQIISGIKTAKFCHKNLFLATAETKEDALMFIYKTLNIIDKH